MTNTKEPELHPFDKAGYGPAPYSERGCVESTDCGLVCDACGKTGLRYKFKLLSSTDQLFGVGSECIKKADPDMWLEMKSRYGAASNISISAVERREAYDIANALWMEYQALNPRSKYLLEYKCGQAFEDVNRVRTATFEKEADQIRERIAIEQRIAQQRAERDAEILPMMKEVGEIYSFRLRTNTVPGNMSTFYRRVAHECAENSNVTDWLRRNSSNLRYVHSFLTRA